MPSRRRKTTSGARAQQLPGMVREENARYDAQSPLPPFASNTEEIRLAVEQNAQDRGTLFIRVLIASRVEEILRLVDEIGQEPFDREEFVDVATGLGIDNKALRILDAADPPIPYIYYFCTPKILLDHPDLVFYYRNIAMLSRKVMHGIGLAIDGIENLSTRLSSQLAEELSSYFNQITSSLVISASTVTPYRHIAMMMTNVGDALGGVSRNEVGRVAMTRILNPLIAHLHSERRLASISYSLKGQLGADDEEDAGETSREKCRISEKTDITVLLRRFDDYRVLYHEIETTNGSRLVINSQIRWQGPNSTEFRIGPDLHSQVGSTDMLWAAELKGGADPAGSDEHWKTATQSFRRIIEAAAQTGRPKPRLSFIATILVERVARDAQTWIDNLDLTSVYNLTQMRQNPQEMDRFLSDVDKFLGCHQGDEIRMSATPDQ